MADPFTIALGVITIFGAARKVCNGLIILKQAPREIVEVRAALDDLTVVLGKVAIHIKTIGNSERPNDLLQIALDEATRVAEPLQSCLQELAASAGSSLLRKSYDRVSWARKRVILKDYAVRLVNVKVSFIFALQAEQLFSSSRIEIKLESIAESCATIELLKEKRYSTHDYSEEGSTTTPFSPTPNAHVSSQINAGLYNNDLVQGCIALEQTGDETLPSSRCNCNCHVDSNWQSPTFLTSIFGKIHVVRKPSAPCYQSNCRKSCAATAVTKSMCWIAPAWWPIQRMISITYISSPYLDPYVSLSFPKIVASDAMIFHFATTGNINGIRQLFEDGAASPNNVKCDGGFTPLHYAINANSIEACKFLIKSGGRADLRTSASVTALDLAIAKVLTRAAEADILAGLAELFTIPDGTDSLRFSRVHEAVLGHKAESLTQALDEDLVNMDQPDANGRTPISWAAARGDETAVRVLIEHLADIPFADLGGMTPLHHAATSTSKQCLDLLLEHGGDPSAKDKDRGWTPLHYAAFHQADPSWVEELLARGANVNVTTDNLKSPLVLAIMKCHDLAARALIKHGALIDARGSDGFTPLNATLMSNDSACMQALIDAGIRFDEVAWEGRTILHMVALYSDEKMIDCLIKEDLACLDVDAIDDAGETALMLLKCRAVSARMMKAFARLCSKISDDVSKRAQVHRPGDKRREDDSQEEVNHG